MFTVTAHTHEMLIEKQSKFISHLMPYSIYDEVLASLMYQQDEECTPGSERDPDTTI